MQQTIIIIPRHYDEGRHKICSDCWNLEAVAKGFSNGGLTSKFQYRPRADQSPCIAPDRILHKPAGCNTVTGSPSMHGNKEYAYSPDLPGRVVKCDKRGGRGTLLRSLSKEPDCNSLCYYTPSLNYLTKKKKNRHR